MNIEDVLDNELAEIVQGNELPGWASDDDKSGNAYRALKQLQHERVNYINTHRNKEDFEAKHSYQLFRVEVAAKAGASMQPLFYQMDFSKKLNNEFRQINDALKKAMLRRLPKKNNAISAKRRSELVTLVQNQNTEIENKENKDVEELLKLTLSKLTADVKRKLKL
jgi:hypothetical protein